ncbi:MAG TPA: hypothetical protein VE967_05210 [Gemmatimonadaceae bacterium]|nr:hypothetical protein [Gemmatimonadaceae bacterium]
MNPLGRGAIAVAVLLLLLATISWVGILSVAAYFFVIPAFLIIVALVFAMVTAGSRRFVHRLDSTLSDLPETRVQDPRHTPGP